MTAEMKERYCPICGKPATEPTYNRFGEWCCSEEHAEEYVKEVRAQREQTTVAGQGRPVSPSRDEEEPWYQEEPAPRELPRQRRWFGRRRGGCG